VHDDLCITKHPSLVGAMYVLTFIDYFLRFSWVYFLKTMDNIFEKLKEFSAFLENQCDQLVKCLRFDNGGEYVNNAFEGYFSHNIITWK
jgi:hypothetical protein